MRRADWRLLRGAGRVYATVNSRVIANREDFGAQATVSPKTLSAAEKVERWKQIWFADVSIGPA
jgi:hypothetical protein